MSHSISFIIVTLAADFNVVPRPVVMSCGGSYQPLTIIFIIRDYYNNLSL